MPVAILDPRLRSRCIYTYKGGMQAVVWTELAAGRRVHLRRHLAAIVILGSVGAGRLGRDPRARRRRAGKTAGDRLLHSRFDRPHTVLGGPDRRRLPRDGVARRRPAHRAAPAVVAHPAGRADARSSAAASSCSASSRCSSSIGSGSGCSTAARSFPAPDADLPDVHPRAHAAGLARADPRRDRRGHDEHALRRDQLARRGDDARHLPAADEAHAPTIRRRSRMGKHVRARSGASCSRSARCSSRRTRSTPVVVVALGIASFTYGGLLGGFFLGIFWRRAIQRDAILGMSVGIFAMAFIVFAKPIIALHSRRSRARWRRSHDRLALVRAHRHDDHAATVGMLSSLTHPDAARAGRDRHGAS